jgi:hypothetical protein
LLDKRITGAVIRVYSDNLRSMQEIVDEFALDYETELISTDNALGEWCAQIIKKGNLDLEGWLHSFSADLEDMRADGMLPPFDDKLVVSVKLIRA